MAGVHASTGNPDGDTGHSARRPGILLVSYREFAAGPGEMPAGFLRRQQNSCQKPAEGTWPGVMRVVAYLPFSASCCAMISAGMRPRSLTSKPLSLAQLRISLLLLSFAAVLRTRGGRPAEPVTLRAALT